MNLSSFRTVRLKIFIIIVVGSSLSIVFLVSPFYENPGGLGEISYRVQFYTGEQVIDEQLRKIEFDNQYAQEIIFKCGRDEHCTVEELQALARNENQQVVLEIIDDILSAYLEVGFYCHAQGHHLGEFFYGYLENLTQALFLANLKCGGSVYHGIIENYFVSEVFFGKSPNEFTIINICDILGDYPSSLMRTDCAHGLGHGITKVLDFDVFTSVKRCDELKTEVEREACYQGVFMENMVENYYTGGGTYDKDDILFPCNKMDYKYADDCYLFHTTRILNEKNNSVEYMFLIV